MYKLIRNLIFSKCYMVILNIIDLMLHTDYFCEEFSDSEYSDSNEVIDTFDMDIDSLKDNLDFDINNVILYAVYVIIMSDIEDKFRKMYTYVEGKNMI